LLRSVEAGKASNTPRSMRRGAHDSVGPRPTYKTAAPTNSAATTPRSQRSTSNTPRSQRAASAAHGTILVNLDGTFRPPRATRRRRPTD
jgi:hypothetical protein